jgi:hypothetical protein
MSNECCDLSGCECHINETPVTDISGNTTEAVVEPTEQERVENTWGLRLRTRMDDLSNQFALIQAPTQVPELHLNEIYIQSMVYLIRFLRLTGEFLQFVWLLVGNVGKGVKQTFQQPVYVFFKDSDHPYLVSDVQLNCSGTPEIEWYYNATTHTFVTSRLYNNSESYHTHHIPYLTAEVRYNDLILYDISEFINSVRWAGEDSEGMPSVNHLLSAWSISSGIVLKRSEQMNLNVINTDGNEAKIPLRNGA